MNRYPFQRLYKYELCLLLNLNTYTNRYIVISDLTSFPRFLNKTFFDEFLIQCKNPRQIDCITILIKLFPVERANRKKRRHAKRTYRRRCMWMICSNYSYCKHMPNHIAYWLSLDRKYLKINLIRITFLQTIVSLLILLRIKCYIYTPLWFKIFLISYIFFRNIK